jgi:hypothetical protein
MRNMSLEAFEMTTETETGVKAKLVELLGTLALKEGFSPDAINRSDVCR